MICHVNEYFVYLVIYAYDDVTWFYVRIWNKTVAIWLPLSFLSFLTAMISNEHIFIYYKWY